MSTSRLVVWIALLAVFAMAARPSVDTDTWWHLRTGQWVVENRAAPQVDPFSYTRFGEPWQCPSWLVQVPMYAIYRLLGPGGLNLWTGLMVALAFGFVWRTLSGGPFLRAFVIVLAAAVSGVYWAARPYLVTFVLAAAFLWLLEEARREATPAAEKRLWWLPVLMVVWANSHGGFAAGFLIWGVYFAGALWELAAARLAQGEAAPAAQGLSLGRLRRLALVGLLLVVAACLNPYGPSLLLYPFKTVSIGVLQDYIQEWQSPNFHILNVQPFAWLLLLTFGVVGASRRRLLPTDFLLTAGFAYMGLLAGRNVALFALAAPMTLTRHAAPLLGAVGRRFGWRPAPLRKPTRLLARLNLALLGLLLLAVLAKAALVFPAQANQAVFAESLPVGAVEYLRQERPPGRLFNSYNYGGYLLWALPEYPVFVDGRTDLYNDELVQEWLRVARGEEGWQGALDRWQVRLVLLEPGMGLVQRLPEAGWALLYQDDLAVVYGR